MRALNREAYILVIICGVDAYLRLAHRGTQLTDADFTNIDTRITTLSGAN